MDGRLGFVTIKPDQLQVFGPICILILIPLFQKWVYPWLGRYSLLTNPLHRLTLGGVLAGVAFIASGLVEIYIKTTYPELPQIGYSQLRIYNGNPCSISLHDQQSAYIIPPLSLYTDKQINVQERDDISFNLAGNCITRRREIFPLQDNKAVSFFINGNNTVRFEENVDKSKSGLPVVRFLVTSRVMSNNITFFNEKRSEIESYIFSGVSLQMDAFMSTYSVRDGGKIVLEGIDLYQGGVYTVIIDQADEELHAKVITITEPNSITMALLLPQFLIISIAEVLFAVTGNEFAFKEAPGSMKAVMTAVWLLTEAVGNVIIIIVTRLFVNYRQETQSFIYTGMMFTSITLFYFLSRGYQIGTEDDVTKKEHRSNSEVMYHQVKQAEDVLDH